jgi:hypothetical protein
MTRLTLALILLAFGCADPSGAHVDGPHPDQQPDQQPADTGEEEPAPEEGGQEVGSATWITASWEGRCSAGELIDADLRVPKGTIITSYLRVADGYGFSAWLDAKEGVVIWGADGLADVSCVYSGRDADYYPFIEGVRVVWLERR